LEPGQQFEQELSTTSYIVQTPYKMCLKQKAMLPLFWCHVSIHSKKKQ